VPTSDVNQARGGCGHDGAMTVARACVVKAGRARWLSGSVKDVCVNGRRS
jgi:hypothetical protein